MNYKADPIAQRNIEIISMLNSDETKAIKKFTILIYNKIYKLPSTELKQFFDIGFFEYIMTFNTFEEFKEYFSQLSNLDKRRALSNYTHKELKKDYKNLKKETQLLSEDLAIFNPTDPADVIFYKELLQSSKTILNPYQLEIFQKRFLENKSLKEIGKDHNKSIDVVSRDLIRIKRIFLEQFLNFSSIKPSPEVYI